MATIKMNTGLVLSVRITAVILSCLLTSGCASSLHDAAYRGDTAKITALLDSGAYDVNTPNVRGWPPLFYAAGQNQFDVVRLLLGRGADINKKDDSGANVLVAAALKGSAEMTRFLIEKGADVDTAIDHFSRHNYTCLGCRNGAGAIQFILEQSGRQGTAQTTSKPIKPPSQLASDSNSLNTTKSDVDVSIPTGKPAGKYDIAVVIGNANYVAPDTPGVDYALHDAQVMKEYLTKTFGYDPANVIYIENATLAKMYEVFGTSDNYQGKLYKWVKPGQSKIFIYYVGHGAPDQQTGEGYFVPVDANPQYINTSGYKLSTFYENLSRIPAVKKTVVIDACFSGSSANGQLIKGVSGLTARLKSEPKASAATDLLLTSAGKDQVASWYPDKGHSLFTYFFLKGIQGEADTNKDGRITMGEMKAWLNDQVPYMARRLKGNEQQPVVMGKDSDDLVVLIR